MHGAVVICGLAIAVTTALAADAGSARLDRPRLLAQALVPPTGAGDADHPMPMTERMNRRFPQPVRVGDLIGLPILDDQDRTLGTVRQVVRMVDGKIALIVAYNRWFGWWGLGTRPVAVPIEVVGILGRELASLDMPASEYAAAPTWSGSGATVLGNDTTIRVALARR